MSKCCSRCKQTKPDNAFYPYKTGINAGHLQSRCIECVSETARVWRDAHPGYTTSWYHRNGKRLPMANVKDCALYLGVVVAEQALSKMFDNIVRMPPTNPGFDFICGKGYKIDCKSACLYKGRSQHVGWHFQIDLNKTADYFLCLAFDDRKHLKPQHVWLIPGNVVNAKWGFNIYNTTESLSKWSEFEKPLDRVQSHCNAMKAEAKE